MKRQSISVFTPSNTEPEVLERIFVQRHRLLEKIVDRLKRSMLTGDKHHVLFIGPRGSGKTNMVTLAHYRLVQQADLQDAMRIAWLGEDDTITGLIDLALGIADRLAAAYPDEFDVDYRSLFRGLPPDDAAEAILAEIHQRLQHRFLWLIVENLDAAFKGLGDHGQKRWRAFLQEKGRVATLATAQQIFDAVSDRDFPFWGFFDIHHLAPLSFEDARILIRNISVENENRELVQFLDTADGRFRIRSLHHLAGGNHRMYVLLSEFLTKESLDDLVAAFETLADKLTPYFQERVRSLPAQQARIVQCLAAATGATTVKEIAALTFIDERSCSKQLGELRNKRYVQSEKRGKESYYELSEPLMRLCLEVKNQRGKPLQLIARFLKVWFTPECFDKLLGAWKSARVKFERGDFAGAVADYTSVIEMPDAPVDQKAQALVYRGVIQWRSEQMREALESFQSAVHIAPQGSEIRCNAMFALPEPLIDVGGLDDVSAALRRAFEENDRKFDDYGGTPNNLFWMVLRRGSRDWDKYVATLIRLYVEFGVADKLARGLTQLIVRLDEGDFSHGQLDQWNAVWQKHGAGIDELEIALQCLSAAIEAIKTKSDRPLFQLPQEVRSLVRTLLNHSPGPGRLT